MQLANRCDRIPRGQDQVPTYYRAAFPTSFGRSYLSSSMLRRVLGTTVTMPSDVTAPVGSSEPFLSVDHRTRPPPRTQRSPRRASPSLSSRCLPPGHTLALPVRHTGDDVRGLFTYAPTCPNARRASQHSRGRTLRGSPRPNCPWPLPLILCALISATGISMPARPVTARPPHSAEC